MQKVSIVLQPWRAKQEQVLKMQCNKQVIFKVRKAQQPNDQHERSFRGRANERRFKNWSNWPAWKMIQVSRDIKWWTFYKIPHPTSLILVWRLSVKFDLEGSTGKCHIFVASYSWLGGFRFHRRLCALIKEAFINSIRERREGWGWVKSGSESPNSFSFS